MTSRNENQEMEQRRVPLFELSKDDAIKGFRRISRAFIIGGLLSFVCGLIQVLSPQPGHAKIPAIGCFITGIVLIARSAEPLTRGLERRMPVSIVKIIALLAGIMLFVIYFCAMALVVTSSIWLTRQVTALFAVMQ